MRRDRELSPSPSYKRRRYSRSPSPVGHRYSSRKYRSRKDRSRSPYSYNRRRSRSISPCRRKSRSPTPRHHKRQKSRSTSLSPIAKFPSIGSIERKNVSEKLKLEEEEKKSLGASNGANETLGGDLEEKGRFEEKGVKSEEKLQQGVTTPYAYATHDSSRNTLSVRRDHALPKPDEILDNDEN